MCLSLCFLTHSMADDNHEFNEMTHINTNHIKYWHKVVGSDEVIHSFIYDIAYISVTRPFYVQCPQCTKIE